MDHAVGSRSQSILTLPGSRIGPKLPPDVWNALFGWLPQVEPVATPTSPPMLGLVGFVLVIVVTWTLLGRLVGDAGVSGRAPRELALSGLLEEHRRDAGIEEAVGSSIGAEVGPGDVAAGEGRTISEIGEQHRQLLAPAEIDWDTREPRVGQQVTKTLVVSTFPDYPIDGFLHELFQETGVVFDLTTYVQPRNQNRAREELKRYADDLQADAQLEGTARASHLAQEAQKAVATSEAVEAGETVYGLSMYVTLRADSQAELQDAEQTLRRTLREDADLVPKVWPGKAHLALPSAAPLGPDRLGEHDPERFRHTALAGGVGALLASLHDPMLIEEHGIEHGIHKQLRTPVIVDPYERENGYAKFVVGDPGSGKSHSSKAHFLRMVSQREDVIGIVIEPLGNWNGVVTAAQQGAPDELAAEHVVIGGDKGVNPLEIRPTPADVMRARGGDVDPFSEKLDDVMAFATNYFEMRSLGDRFAEHRTTFYNAVRDAYVEQAGITADPSTHDRESPTLGDEVLTELERRVDEPKQYVTMHESEAQDIAESARWLLRQLGPFKDGEFESLGRHSEIDIFDSDLVYLDLAQQEGGVSNRAVLTLQLLVSLVYERAKQTDKKVVLAMDEFRYFVRDAADLHFIETLFRHHRHHDISPWIITQTVDEFLAREESQTILEMCSIKQFHLLESTDLSQWAHRFDLNPGQQRFVKEAQPGSADVGYSDALLGVDGEWRELEVHTFPNEFDVIEFDPEQNSVGELPGIDD